MRQVAKAIHPRLIITEDNGHWTVRAETAVKTKTINFTPGVEFDDTTIDGREVKVSFFFPKFSVNVPIKTFDFFSSCFLGSGSL